jgi:hypothetical protein
MDKLLVELYHLLTNDPQSVDLYYSHRITTIITELLDAFGLPPHKGYENILLEFGRAEHCSNDTINDTLITLADAGIYYQTLLKLAR